MADDGYHHLADLTALEVELDTAANLMGVTRFQVAGTVARLQDVCARLRKENEELESKLTELTCG